MAELVRRIEWNARAAAVIAVLLFGTIFACAPTWAQDEEEEDAVTPMTGCAQRDRPDASMLERVRRRLTVTACASSAWLDGLFGDQFRYDEYRATYGTVSAGGLWSDYDGFDPRLRFRVRLQLPQWDERISAFAGRVGEDDYISDTEGDFEALPTRQFGNLEDESVLVGLGYSSPERTGNDFDVGVGVRVDLPLDPYARARYEIVRGVRRALRVHRARDRVLAELGRLRHHDAHRISTARSPTRCCCAGRNLGKYTEETIGLEWYTQLTLFQSLNDAHRARVAGADRRRDGQRSAADAPLRAADPAPAADVGLAVPRAARRRLLAAPQAQRGPRSEPRSRRRAGNAVRQPAQRSRSRGNLAAPGSVTRNRNPCWRSP